MSDYFRDLQNIATEQDRAKLAAVAAEYRSTLQQLPKLQQEMDSLLAPGQLLDYIDLTKNVRPRLEQATRFLFDLDQLPAELRNAREVTEFVQSAKASMTLQTIAPMTAKLPFICSTARQRLATELIETKRLEREAELTRLKREAEIAEATKLVKESEFTVRNVLVYLLFLVFSYVFFAGLGVFVGKVVGLVINIFLKLTLHEHYDVVGVMNTSETIGAIGMIVVAIFISLIDRKSAAAALTRAQEILKKNRW
jgi:hypothetical protein